MDQEAKPQPKFVIKDSGQRTQFESGMVRDVTTDKTNVALIYDGPMFWRWAKHLSLGAIKYAKRNWMKAEGHEELERFKESAARHFFQWYRGDVDEDHASAVFFNINGAEYVKEKLERGMLKNANSAFSVTDLSTIPVTRSEDVPQSAGYVFKSASAPATGLNYSR